MKALIVDDEPLARRELRRLLAAFEWVEIIGEASNINEAHSSVDTLAPDLLFLDIQMPGGSGFDLLTRIEHLPRVIFTTAFDHHAVHAFEVNALDYLLKPIEPERLNAALARAQNAMVPNGQGLSFSQWPGQRTAPAVAAQSGAAIERLFIRDGSRCWFVPLREVSLMVAEGNYVRLHWGDARPLLARPLSSLEERLDPVRYFRANRRQIINLEFIENVELGTGGLLHVQLRDGPEVEISRRQARLFRAQMSV